MPRSVSPYAAEFKAYLKPHILVALSVLYYALRAAQLARERTMSANTERKSVPR